MASGHGLSGGMCSHDLSPESVAGPRVVVCRVTSCRDPPRELYPDLLGFVTL